MKTTMTMTATAASPMAAAVMMKASLMASEKNALQIQAMAKS